MAAHEAVEASVLAVKLEKCQHGPEQNYLTTVNHSSLIEDVFYRYHQPQKNITLKIKCATRLRATASEMFTIEGGICVSTLVNQFGIKMIKFTCESQGPTTNSSNTLGVLQQCVQEADAKAVDAFQILMAGGRTFPTKKTSSQGMKDGSLSNKDQLYNKLVDKFIQNDMDFPRSTVNHQGSYFIQVLCNSLWYVTNHHTTINIAASRFKDVLPIPPDYEDFDGYNNYKRKKVKMEQLSSDVLEGHSQALYSLLLKPVCNSTSSWVKGCDSIKQLADCLQSYVLYLRRKNIDMKEIHGSTTAARTIDKHATLDHKQKNYYQVNERYRMLDQAVVQKGTEGFVVFDEMVHIDTPFKSSDEKYKYFKSLQLSVPVDIIRFCPGGSLEATICIHQVSPNRSEREILTEGARFLQAVRPELTEIHTRTQRKNFKDKLKNIAEVSPAISNFIYSNFTLDKSAVMNTVTQERLRLIYLGQTGLVKDLRELNPGRPSDHFDKFFEVMSGLLEDVTSADDRRHGVAHMSKFISLEDLMAQTKDLCPDGTAVPSKSLVRLQFAPKNPFTRLATTFTSKLNLQYKIQRRQLRVEHPDEHYCNAQFRYLKECAIENKQNARMIFCDDKAKVPFGNPGSLVSTGVRGKQTIVPASSTLCALDHDMQSVGSITPSVYLNCDIPDTINSSFVRGDVTIVLNDSVFMQSTPFRHSAALAKLLTLQGDVPALLYKFTDGGTDQRNTLESVKCASVCLFRELNLDMLVLGRCAPGHSFINPAERVMSVLNLGLQNVALERSPCDDETMDKLVKQCNSMNDIRAKNTKHPGLKEAWQHCIAEVLRTVENRFSRLKLKDRPFQIMKPVTENEIEEHKRHLRELFPDLDLNKLVKSTTSKSISYKQWMATHARSRQYTFQLRKCSDTACCLPPTLPADHLHWLPDPVLDETGLHYKPYHLLKGTDTTDDQRPSLSIQKRSTTAKKRSADDLPDDTPSLQSDVEPTMTVEDSDPKLPVPDAHLCTVQNARALVFCSECTKPRVIYSKYKLTVKEKDDLDKSLNEYVYSCGGPLMSPFSPLFGNCMCRAPLACSSPIETPYYGCELGRKDLCCYCAVEGCCVDQELKKQYKTVLPICDSCKTSNVTVFMRPYGKSAVKGKKNF